MFESPEGVWYLTSIRIHGARYGYPQPPNEDFHVTLCDKNYKPIKDYTFPYAAFERKSEPDWVTLKLEPAKVPEKFVICLNFNAEADQRRLHQPRRRGDRPGRPPRSSRTAYFTGGELANPPDIDARHDGQGYAGRGEDVHERPGLRGGRSARSWANRRNWPSTTARRPGRRASPADMPRSSNRRRGSGGSQWSASTAPVTACPSRPKRTSTSRCATRTSSRFAISRSPIRNSPTAPGRNGKAFRVPADQGPQGVHHLPQLQRRTDQGGLRQSRRRRKEPRRTAGQAGREFRRRGLVDSADVEAGGVIDMAGKMTRLLTRRSLLLGGAATVVLASPLALLFFRRRRDAPSFRRKKDAEVAGNGHPAGNNHPAGYGHSNRYGATPAPKPPEPFSITFEGPFSRSQKLLAHPVGDSWISIAGARFWGSDRSIPLLEIVYNTPEQTFLGDVTQRITYTTRDNKNTISELTRGAPTGPTTIQLSGTAQVGSVDGLRLPVPVGDLTKLKLEYIPEERSKRLEDAKQ